MEFTAAAFWYMLNRDFFSGACLVVERIKRQTAKLSVKVIGFAQMGSSLYLTG